MDIFRGGALFGYHTHYMYLEAQNEKREREWGREIFEEILVRNYPKLVKDTKPQIQEDRIPQSGNTQTSTHHIQTAKNKEKENVEGREKRHITYRRTKVRSIANMLPKSRRQ